MKEKDVVIKSNRLNTVIQNLSMVEIRIMQLAFIDARETGKGLSVDKPLTIRAERYAEAFGIDKNNAYAIIKEAEDTLFKRQFRYLDGDGNVVKSRWVHEVRYLEKQGKIELCLTRSVINGIMGIDGAVEYFTKYLLSNTVNFKSVYSVRLYELLAQWKNSKTGKTNLFELQEFRGQLGVAEHEYKLMHNFKSRVLDLAVKEINEHSDLEVSYEQKKKGRVIVGFVFNVKVKKQAKAREITPPNPADISKLFDGVENADIIKAQADEYIGKLMADGKTITKTHATNVYKKAIAERWGVEQFDLQDEKEKQRQQSERQAIDDLEARQAKAEQKFQAFQAYFESLPSDEQNAILDEVQVMLPPLMAKVFAQEREANTAHQNRKIAKQFYKVAKFK